MTLTDAPEAGARAAILRPLAAFNEAQAGPVHARLLAMLPRAGEGGEVVGGLRGRTSRGWMHGELPFVPGAMRGSGLGEAMLRCAEAEAVRRGCRGARLDTYSFQARGLYERLGYRVCGEIEDCPPGHRRYSPSKRLAAAG